MFWSPQQDEAVFYTPDAGVDGVMSFASLRLENVIGRQDMDTAHIDIHLMHANTAITLEEDAEALNPCYGWVDVPHQYAYGMLHRLGNFNGPALIPDDARTWNECVTHLHMEMADLTQYALPAYQPMYRGTTWWLPKMEVVITADFTATTEYYNEMFGKDPLFYF